MKNIFNLGLLIVTALVSVGCDGDKHDYEIQTGEAKFSTLEDNCFYDSARPTPPILDPADPNYDPNNPNFQWYKKQYIAFKYLPNGRLMRMRAGYNLQIALDNASDMLTWIEILDNANANQFVPYLNAVPNLPNNSPVTSVAAGLNTAAKPRLPDPIDLELNWFSTLAFKIVEFERPDGIPISSVKFDELFPSFVVLDGGKISPFYDPVRHSDDVTYVNYVSIPPDSTANVEKIQNRECIYEYILNTVNTFTSQPGAIEMQTRLTIDPGGEGDGDDPPTGEPTGWP